MLHEYFRLAALEMGPFLPTTFTDTRTHILYIHIVVTVWYEIELNVGQRIEKEEGRGNRTRSNRTKETESGCDGEERSERWSEENAIPQTNILSKHAHTYSPAST